MDFASYSKSLKNQPDSVLRLSNPRRNSLVFAELGRAYERILGPKVWKDLVEVLKDDHRTASSAIREMELKGTSKPLIDMLRHFAGGGLDPFAQLVEIRNRLYPCPYFVIDDSLAEMLEHTEMSDDIPASLLQLPFPRTYIEIGPARKISPRMLDASSGEHIFEGAFCEQGDHYPYGPGLMLMLTGSPLGKGSAAEDTYFTVFLPQSVADQSLNDALTWALANSPERPHFSAQSPAIKAIRECLLLWAKSVLYIGLPEARKISQPEHSTLLKEISGKKSGAKRAKLERKLLAARDFIVISAPPSSLSGNSNGRPDGSRSVRSHWRRGHYRMQAHGTKFSLRRLIFLKPTLVHGDVGVSATVKNYSVR